MPNPSAPHGGERTLRPERVFLHPLWLLALVLLVLNDHFLKGSGLLPGMVTGKLSDFTGLVVAPALLAALLPWRRRATWAFAHLAVGLVFTLLQLSPALAQLWTALLGMLSIPSRFVSDPSDLLALPMLAVSHLFFYPWASRSLPKRALQRCLEGVALSVGLAASLATSQETQGPPVDPTPVCGDGSVDLDAGEECDDGNYNRGDGCFQCKWEACGDGTVMPRLGESCEDGNYEANDGCNDCAVEPPYCDGAQMKAWFCPDVVATAEDCIQLQCPEDETGACPQAPAQVEMRVFDNGRFESKQPHPQHGFTLGEPVCLEELSSSRMCTLNPYWCQSLVASPAEDYTFVGWRSNFGIHLEPSLTFDERTPIQTLAAIFEAPEGQPQERVLANEEVEWLSRNVNDELLLARSSVGSAAAWVALLDASGAQRYALNFGTEQGGLRILGVMLDERGETTLAAVVEGVSVELGGQLFPASDAVLLWLRLDSAGNLSWVKAQQAGASILNVRLSLAGAETVAALLTVQGAENDGIGLWIVEPDGSIRLHADLSAAQHSYLGQELRLNARLGLMALYVDRDTLEATQRLICATIESDGSLSQSKLVVELSGQEELDESLLEASFLVDDLEQLYVALRQDGALSLIHVAAAEPQSWQTQLPESAGKPMLLLQADELDVFGTQMRGDSKAWHRERMNTQGEHLLSEAWGAPGNSDALLGAWRDGERLVLVVQRSSVEGFALIEQTLSL
jgi:cysteine-rich repeat protein